MIFSKSITFDEGGVETAIAPVRTADSPLFIDRLRSGENAAFTELVDRYSDEVFSLLYRITTDFEEAQDLTQETFIRALRAIRGFRGDAGLRTWLFRIAINESRNRFRWWKRRQRDRTLSLDAPLGDMSSTLGDTLRSSDLSPEESTLSAERETALSRALGQVAKIYREAVILTDIQGLAYQEAADALEITLGTLKSRVFRGREELRRRLRDI